tara:strand:- start:39 stop:974 length:936 start_codon:yes stop_codon:yes gene_type:complete
MKNILGIVVLSLLFLNLNYTYVKAKKYKVNDIVENIFIVDKKFKIDLPNGKWVVAETHIDNYYGLISKIYRLVKLENNIIVEYIEIAQMKTAGIHEHIVNQAIREALFKNKYDGCYDREEYAVVKFYAKGSTHNCFWVGHSDVYKNLYNPDDPDLKIINSKFRRWVKNNNIQLPKVALFSNHAYFSRLAAGKWFLLSHVINPKILNAPINKFINEETSEYHKYNIANYPEHKKIMEKWISISAQRHIEFESSIGAITRHRLNLNDLSPIKKKLNKNSSNKIIDQIQKLNELYKSGALTKEEFTKAKKKILN